MDVDFGEKVGYGHDQGGSILNGSFGYDDEFRVLGRSHVDGAIALRGGDLSEPDRGEREHEKGRGEHLDGFFVLLLACFSTFRMWYEMSWVSWCRYGIYINSSMDIYIRIKK